MVAVQPAPAPGEGPLAAPIVQICCKDPDRIGAREETLIFRAFIRGRSRRRAPLWQIWTRPRPESSQEPHPHHPAPVRPNHHDDPGPRTVAPGEKCSKNLLPRRLFSGIMAALSCLDHLRAVGPLKCRWTTWFTKYGGPTERKWSNRTQVVQPGRPRHDMRDAVPPCGTRRRGGAGAGGAAPLSGRAASAVGPGVAVLPWIALQNLVQPPRVQQAPDLNDCLIIGGVEAKGGQRIPSKSEM